MEKQTKILLGLGLAGLAAYFILKPKSNKTEIVSTNVDVNKYPTGLRVCPNGYTLKQVQCIQAPCPPQCVPNDETMQNLLEKLKLGRGSFNNGSQYDLIESEKALNKQYDINKYLFNVSLT